MSGTRPSYFELQKRCEEAEAALRQVSKVEKNVSRYQRFFLGLRELDRLIVRETDTTRYVDEACRILTEEVGYGNAWLVVLAPDGEGVAHRAFRGPAKGFRAVDERLARGVLPECMRRARRERGTVAVRDPDSECPKCPLTLGGDRAVLVRGLRLREKVRGFLHVSLPRAMISDRSQQDLFRELADDLTRGLRRIEERKTLAEERVRVLDLLKTTPEGFQALDSRGRVVDVNERWLEALGYEEDEDELVGSSFESHVAGEERERLQELLTGLEKGGSAEEGELLLLRKDGEPVRYAFRARAARGLPEAGEEAGEEEEVFGSYWIFREIREEEREPGERARQEQPRARAETEGEIPETLESEQSGPRQPATPEPAEPHTEPDQNTPQPAAPEPAEPEPDVNRPRLCDYSLLTESMEGGIWAVDRMYRFITGNAVFQRQITELRGRPFLPGERVLTDELDEASATEWRQYYDWALEGQRFGVESQGYGLAPSRRLEYHFNPIRGADGSVIGATVREQDITEKKQTEEELRRSRELLLASQRMAGMTWVMWDLETGEVTASDALYELLLYDPSRQLDVEEFFVRIHHPDDAARVREWLGAAIAAGRNEIPPLEYRVLRTDGEVRHVRVAGVIERREKGRPKVFATLQDVTERKVAEEERLKLEEEHLMSRKMEALGQLTGGVAHDFNNLLQVINGGADIAMLDLPEGHPARDAVEQIAGAGKQAARLVSQLLFFGRRQVMHPAILDLNEVVEDFFRMSPDIVGENIDVLWRHRMEVSPIRADRTMVEQVLLNLCRNAEEAMPRGGDLTLETRDVDVGEEYRVDHPWARPGRYVLLRVSDTGTGMDEETRDRVFEPFFSTKGPGKGSGLGLSTVYGIIKQHGGMIDVESEPGRGTVFDLFWPVAEVEEDEAEETKPAGEGGEEGLEGAQETILLAEDEEMVREMARMILERAGYTVLAVRDGAEALAAFEERAEEIDLAILDVVMPGVGGREAYEQMRARRPGLRALFATGYNMNAVQADFYLDEGLDLIEKPFSRKDLLRAVQRLLEESG